MAIISVCVSGPSLKGHSSAEALGSSVSGSLPGYRSAWLAQLSVLLAHRCTLLPTRRPHCSLLPCFAWKNLAMSACLVRGSDIFYCTAHMSKNRPGLFNSYRDKHLITELTVGLFYSKSVTFHENICIMFFLIISYMSCNVISCHMTSLVLFFHFCSKQSYMAFISLFHLVYKGFLQDSEVTQCFIGCFWKCLYFVLLGQPHSLIIWF